MFQTITLSSKRQEMTVMDQPIKNSIGNHLIKENPISFAEFQIGGNNRTLILIAIRYDVEKQFHSFPIQGDVSLFSSPIKRSNRPNFLKKVEIIPQALASASLLTR